MSTAAHQHRPHSHPAGRARVDTLADWTASAAAVARRVAATGVAQVVMLFAAAAAYFGVRHLTHSSRAAAEQHAGWVQSFERALGLHRERWLQQQALPHRWIIDLADDVYIYGHWPVIIAALLWLLWHHRAEFVVARNALLLSGGVALVIFALFPVAPPRLADPSIVDTVTLHTRAYRVMQPPAFTDVYAAMPSLHCGWDLLVAVAISHTLRRSWAKAAVLAIPVVMAASVVITGNHYLVDVVVGDSLAVSALLVARRRAARSAA